MKMGKSIGLAVENRRQQQEFGEVMGELQPQLDAIDNEMAIARQVLEIENEKIRKGEFVSAKDLGGALYGATAKQIELLDKKKDIVAGAISKYPTNRYLTQGLGAIAKQATDTQNAGLRTTETAMNAISNMMNTDIAAVRAQTGVRAQEVAERQGDVQLEQGQQRVDIASRAQESTEKHQRAQEDIAREGIDVRREELKLAERRVVTDEESLDLRRELGLGQLSVAQKNADRMTHEQRVEELGVVVNLASKAGALGLPMDRVAEMWNKAAGGESNFTAEDFQMWSDRYAGYEDDVRAELVQTDQRIKRAKEEVARGVPGADKDLKREQTHRLLVVNTDRATRNAVERTAYANSLKGLEHLIYKSAKQWTDSIAYMEGLVNIGGGGSIRRAVESGKAGTAAEEALQATFEETNR
ncbi:MAG: hypothetical protein ACYSWU_12745 [Planctomycetota bacterium]